MSIAGFFDSLDLFMIAFFVLTVTLIMVYEYNLHRRVKKETH